MLEEIIIRPDGSRDVRHYTVGPSLTRQEFKAECDLEAIVKRHVRDNGSLNAFLEAQAFVKQRFEDVSSVPDYRSALELIERSNEAFERLPPQLRSRFQNDPAKFLDFLDDEKNLPELRAMGLVQPEAKSEPLKTA